MFGHYTYLVFELAWGIPVLALQWAVGAKQLIRSSRLLLIGSLVPTIYLSLADGIAIGAGIWRLQPDRIVQLFVVNVPMEEVIFFLITNLMIVQTVILIGYGSSVIPAWLSRQLSRTETATND